MSGTLIYAPIAKPECYHLILSSLKNHLPIVDIRRNYRTVFDEVASDDADLQNSILYKVAALFFKKSRLPVCRSRFPAFQINAAMYNPFHEMFLS